MTALYTGKPLCGYQPNTQYTITVTHGKRGYNVEADDPTTRMIQYSSETSLRANWRLDNTID